MRIKYKNNKNIVFIIAAISTLFCIFRKDRIFGIPLLIVTMFLGIENKYFSEED